MWLLLGLKKLLLGKRLCFTRKYPFRHNHVQSEIWLCLSQLRIYANYECPEKEVSLQKGLPFFNILAIGKFYLIMI